MTVPAARKLPPEGVSPWLTSHSMFLPVFVANRYLLRLYIKSSSFITSAIK